MSTENKPMDHDYDGIEEYDNALPNWWLATLWITIFFGIGYWGYFHSTEKGLTSAEIFEIAEKERLSKLEAKQKDKPKLSNERLADIAKNPKAMKEAGEIYKTNCSACHGANGEGLVGPSLTDAEWIYGSSGMEVFSSIMDGRKGNQMPAWGPVLGETKVSQVTAYVMEMKDSGK